MAAAAAGGGEWTPERSVAGSANPWLIVAMISLPTFMEVLDTSIANVSLNHIAGGLSISTDQATWVLTSYLVANAVIIPISGWLTNVIGRKRYFMLSIALFAGASFLCGIAPNLQFLILARVLQGIGGGGLAPVEQSMLADTFPPEKRGMAFATFAIVVIVGPVFGPTLGGYITDQASWHWIFLINVPVGIVALILVQIFVDEPEAIREEHRKMVAGGIRLDYVGFGLVALGLGLLEYTLDRGERLDWFSSSTITLTAITAVVSLVAFVIWELRHPDPVVNIRLLGVRNFAISNVIMFSVGAIVFSTTQLIPQMLQQVLGYSATDAGMALTFGGFATLLLVPIAGQLTDRVDVRFLLFPAMVVEAGALWYMTGLNADISFWDASMARLFQSVGLPFLFVPVTAAAYIGLKPNQTGQASSILNVFRNLGGTVGIAFSQTTLSTSMQIEQANLAYQLNPFNHNYTDWMNKAAGVVGGSTEIRMSVLYQIMQQQATMNAFLDTFSKLMVLVLIVSPVALFLKTQKGAKAPPGAH